MDIVGIDKAVVLPRDPEFAARIVQRYPTKLVPFYMYNADAGKKALTEMEHYIKAKGFKGVKLNSTIQYYYNDERLSELYDKVVELDVPILLHGGIIYRDPEAPAKTKVRYLQPIYLDDVARDFPRLKIILGHAGRPFLDQSIALCLNPNVTVDISWSQLPIHFWPETIQKVLIAFGPDRLLYGSDTQMSPSEGGPSYTGASRIIKSFNEATHILYHQLRVDEPSIRKIMGQNAARLLNL